MKRTWTIIGVADVPASFARYRGDGFDAALARARGLVAHLVDAPTLNPGTGTREFSLRDPDGYDVTISALGAA